MYGGCTNPDASNYNPSVSWRAVPCARLAGRGEFLHAAPHAPVKADMSPPRSTYRRPTTTMAHACTTRLGAR
eukprot:scaffold10432_cov130-Isochrysis_galbana.AAC.1